MTAQIAESLVYRKKRLSLTSTPLDQYLRIADIKLDVSVFCTALWRGYVGSWKIAHGRLYLAGLEGTLADGSELTLEHLFPGHPDRVFAHWFTGDLCAPQGKLLKYIHAGFASIYERELILHVEQGVVTAEEVRQNGLAPSEASGPEGYRVAGYTMFPRPKRTGQP